jgi:environmental stress-induced protein Ves
VTAAPGATASGPEWILRAADRAAAAWKNGGGVTREVAASPPGAGMDDFDWRVSLADVARGGPFSRFPGVDRVITVVEGAGMELEVDGAAHLADARYAPFAFPGDADTGCRLLDGPIVDFNVMTRRDRVRATVEIVDADRTLPTGPGPGPEQLLVLVLRGEAAVGGHTLGRYDAALLDSGQPADGVSLGFGGPDGLAAVVGFAPVTRP